MRCRPTARLSTLLACAWLAGCAGTGAPLAPLSEWETRQQVLAAAPSWGFTGRVAVSDGEDGFNGRLNWEQRRDYFDVRVSGPLGAGTVLLAGDSDVVRVTEKDGRITELVDPETELRRRYGWHIPVTRLRYWALGIPDPDEPAETRFGDDGLLAELEQDGWTIRIRRYRDAGGRAMPRSLSAERGAARVRLAIDRWRFD